MSHVFFMSYAAHSVWYYFLSNVGIAMEGLSLQQAVVKCWTIQVILGLKPIFQALPSIILWELWIRRNYYKYGDVVTISRVISQVSSTLKALVTIRKPSL